MELTYKNKNLSYDDKRAIEALKRDMIKDQGSRCYVCDKPFNVDRLPEMAHIISKADRNIKKYGYEVINHKYNMVITCADCNSSIMINTSKKALITKHLEPIYDNLVTEGYKIGSRY